jgi:hypothetical protein
MSRTDSSPFAGFRRLSPAGRGVLFVLVLAFGVFLLSRAARQPFHSEITTLPKAAPSSNSPDTDLKAEWQRLKESSRITPPTPAPIAGSASAGAVDGFGYGSPLVSHAAELAVATKEFSRSRSNLEEILERHHGYASKLRMVGQPSGSTLTATFRVPSSEFSSALSDLKTLGNVEREEQTADEITQQQADLEARLTNAQNTLQRLQGILPKASNAVNIQRELQAVGAEITRLEAQRAASQNRAIFANVLFSLREEITPPVESFGAQFRRAARAGLSDALNSLSGIVLVVVSYGPAIFVWTLLIAIPGRWMWKKWRPTIGPAAAHSEQGT